MNLFENKIEYIPLKHIEVSNRFFEFSVSDNSESLHRSISRFGVLHPLWVCSNKKSLEIISGFKRIDAAMKVGLNEVPVRRLCENITVEQAFQYVIEEQKSHRELNVIEIARILNIIKRLGYSDTKIPAHFLSLIHLSDNHNLLKKYGRLLELTDRVRNYIGCRNMSLKQSEMFRDLSREEQNLFMDMAENLNITGHELKVICIQLYEISRREHKTVKTVWETLELNLILNDASIKRNQKIEAIRQLLKEERFPVLSKNNHCLCEKLSTLSLRSGGKWSWDPTFERAGLIYHMEFVRHEDCENIVHDFSHKENRKTLSDILKKI